MSFGSRRISTKTSIFWCIRLILLVYWMLPKESCCWASGPGIQQAAGRHRQSKAASQPTRIAEKASAVIRLQSHLLQLWEPLCAQAMCPECGPRTSLTGLGWLLELLPIRWKLYRSPDGWHMGPPPNHFMVQKHWLGTLGCKLTIRVRTLNFLQGSP